MIRTLVTAASALARAGLAAVVRDDARLALVGTATPAELNDRIAALAPHVVLEQGELDPDIAHAPTVFLVDDPREAWTDATLAGEERGPYAVLARDASRDEIAAAIVAVAAGLIAVQPSALVPAIAEMAPLRGSERLTSRETEVLSELARGVPNKTIATRLDISEHTVKFHVASIFAKLAVSSRTEAVTQGVRLGVIML